jgi:hypothetical protein
MRYHATKSIALIAAFAFPVAAVAQKHSAGWRNHRGGAAATGAPAEAADGGASSGAVIRFLWLPPQGLTADPYPPGTIGVGTPDLRLGGVPPEGQPLWLGVFISNWGPQADLNGWFARLDEAALSTGFGRLMPECQTNDECFNSLGPGSLCGFPPVPEFLCAPAFQQTDRADFESFGVNACSPVVLACGGWITEIEPPHPDPGTERYGATVVLLAFSSLSDGPHVIPFDEDDTFMAGPGAEDDMIVNTVPGALSIRRGSCCFDIGLASAGCASDVTPLKCEAINTGPLPPVFREDEPCPGQGGSDCPLALGACCNAQAGPLAEAGLCEDAVQYSDCQCPTCTWFQDQSCDGIFATGLCSADFAPIPTVSEWGLVVMVLLLLIGSKLLSRWRFAARCRNMWSRGASWRRPDFEAPGLHDKFGAKRRSGRLGRRGEHRLEPELRQSFVRRLQDPPHLAVQGEGAQFVGADGHRRSGSGR